MALICPVLSVQSSHTREIRSDSIQKTISYIMTIVVAVCLFARYAANDLSLTANVSETAYRNVRKDETVLKTAIAGLQK